MRTTLGGIRVSVRGLGWVTPTEADGATLPVVRIRFQYC